MYVRITPPVLWKTRITTISSGAFPSHGGGKHRSTRYQVCYQTGRLSAGISFRRCRCTPCPRRMNQTRTYRVVHHTPKSGKDCRKYSSRRLSVHPCPRATANHERRGTPEPTKIPRHRSPCVPISARCRCCCSQSILLHRWVCCSLSVWATHTHGFDLRPRHL